MTGKLSDGLVSGARATTGLEFYVAVLLLCIPRVVAAQVHELGQDPIAGSAVFEAKGCMECHAVNGLGGTYGPDLGRIPRRRSFSELAATMWNHVPLMRAGMSEIGIERPEMDAEEAADLIGFLFTLHYFDAPGDVEAGRRLFNDKKCVVCHRVGNYGGEVGPSLDHVGRYGSPILVAAAMLNHGAAMANSIEPTGVQRPEFENSELVDLIAYLVSAAPQPLEGRVYVLPGRAEAGRVVFIEKRCDQCHSVSGVGGQIGPDLSQVDRQWSMTEFAAAMWNKLPKMVKVMGREGISVPQIGGGEMADLVAYLYSVEYFVEPGDVEHGAVLLSEKGCKACHSVAGTGAGTASDLSRVQSMSDPPGVVASLWNHAGVIETRSEGTEASWPVLSREEMADLAAFFQALAEQR
jgi:cytochrome c2